MQLNIFSFFSGAGFLDLGFEYENYNIVFVNEYNESFLKTYKHSRKKMKMNTPIYGYYCGDANKLQRGNLKKKLLQYVDNSKIDGLVGFIGGPPCPDYAEKIVIPK